MEGEDVEHPKARTSYNTPSWLQNISQTIRHFDLEIVNAFLGAFLLHIEPVFSTFKGFSFTAQTLPDVILAMAAVGGLYSDHRGSFHIAIAMFTDSRRLVLGRVRLPLFLVVAALANVGE